MAVTTIDGVKTLQIRKARNGDFDLNLAGGGGDSKPFYPIIEFDSQMQVTKIEQGVVSAQGGTVIGRLSDGEKAFSVITLASFSPNFTLINRYFVSLDDLGTFELILNSENEIAEAQFINGRISVFNGSQPTTIDSGRMSIVIAWYAGLISVDDSTQEETITRFPIVDGGKRAIPFNSDIVPLNYETTSGVFIYNRGSNITLNEGSELYRVISY